MNSADADGRHPNLYPPITKSITLIRHGVALHNICDEKTGAKPDVLDPKFTDSPLTRHGELQAFQLGERLRRIGLVRCYHEDNADGGSTSVGTTAGCRSSSDAETSPIELVICSPLTRCLQTASHIFPSYFRSSFPSPDTSTDVQLDRNCTVCCHADVREAFGKNYSDKRSPLSRLKTRFPTVHYHPSITEDDIDWQPHTRETCHNVSRRVHNFFVWLLQQPHSNVAIVTHGVWMECALLNYCPEVLEFGKKRVYNCDVYSGKLLGSSDGRSIMLTDVEQMTFDE